MAPNNHPPFPRIFAPMLHRPTSRLAHGLLRDGVPDPDRGFRTYTDQPLRRGDVLEVDVLLPDRSTVSAVVRVNWCEPIPGGSPARFDVGLGIARMDLADLARLEVVLRPPQAPPATAPAPEPVRPDPRVARAQELHDALRRVLDARDHFLAAVRASPEDLVPVPEEERYLAALTSARSVLTGVEVGG
jgi:hypothetical protein